MEPGTGIERTHFLEADRRCDRATTAGRAIQRRVMYSNNDLRIAA